MTSTFYKHSIATTLNDGYLMEEELQFENYRCRRCHQSNCDCQQHHISGLSTREASSDSVILALDWHFSCLFSSSGASVDHFSDASDAPLHLAGSLRESWNGGPDPNQNKTGTASVHHKQDSRFYSKHIVKAKVQKEDHDGDVEVKDDDDDDEDVEEEHNLPIYSSRSSFSLALKECQERRSRSKALSRKSDRTRPGSVDFNDGIAPSPMMGAVKAGSTGSRKSGTFPSPGTPNHRNPSIGLQKGRSSERVPPQSYAGMKNRDAAFLPFNHNGMTLPSKWEDAERWIFSPVSTDNFISPVPQPLRRPKSKSGPLGPPGVAYNSLHSPAKPMYGGGNVGNFIGRSPLCAGVIGAEGFRISGSQGVSYQACAEHCMGRSVSVQGYSDPLDQTCTVPQDENLDKQKNAATDASRRSVSRRDMGTQMSPHESTCSSPQRTLSSSASSHDLQILELSSVRFPKLEMKDVLVDERVVTRRSRKSKYRIPEKSSENSDEWKTKYTDVQSCVRDVLDPVKRISKVKRDEVKITAWENLQKAKAEAAIRKLEMNLEKKRSSSMDKIMKKLRSAQKRAQEMRNSVVSNQDPRPSNNPYEGLIFRRAGPIGSLCGCFTPHAF